MGAVFLRESGLRTSLGVVFMSMNQLLTLSSADLKKAAALQTQIELLQSRLARLIGAEAGTAPPVAKSSRGPVSEARRKRLSRIAKQRWKKVKAEGKNAL
jgi:hypothetical protein